MEEGGKGNIIGGVGGVQTIMIKAAFAYSRESLMRRLGVQCVQWSMAGGTIGRDGSEDACLA